MFGVPSSNQGKIYFKNATGYNNSVYLLNDICKNRYSNVSLGATARSLNLEDIESRMNSRGIETRNKYKSGTIQYGTTKNIQIAMLNIQLYMHKKNIQVLE